MVLSRPPEVLDSPAKPDRHKDKDAQHGSQAEFPPEVPPVCCVRQRVNQAYAEADGGGGKNSRPEQQLESVLNVHFGIVTGRPALEVSATLVQF